VTGEEIRAAARPLLHSAFAQAVGSRPRRYQPEPEVLNGLRQLATEPAVRANTLNGDWRVVEGRRWLLNRRLDGRSVPLVQRDHVAIVVRSWAEARELAALLNWCDAPLPPRYDTASPAYLAARVR
jgi:hypothetical protein